jgi:putative inorganic carbon (hco3(-)) transporter
MTEHALTSSTPARFSALRRHLWTDSAAGALVAIAIGFLVVHMPAAPTGPLLLLAVAAPVVALVVGDLRRVLLAVVLLDIPLHWDVNLGWRPDAVAVGAVGGISISATTVALCGLYALWIAERTAGRSHPLRLWPALPLVAYVAVTALSLVVAEDRQLGVFELLLLMQTLLLFLYVANQVRTQQDVVFIVVGLLAGFLLESTIMIAISALGLSFQWIGLSSNTRELVGASASDVRVGGTIGGANGAAAYIAMLLPISIVVLWMDLAVWIKRLALVATGVGIVALVLTYSRGGWLAAVVAALFVASVAIHRRDVPGGRVAAAGAVVLLLLVPFHGSIEARISGQTQGGAYSQNARLPLIQLAWKMIQDRPILGVGANNFAPAVSRYAGPEFSGAWLRSVHSLYFLAWAEAGFGALLALLWFLGSSLRRGWRAFTRAGPLSPLALGLTASILSAIVTMGVERFIARPLIQLLWLLAALLVAVEAVGRSTEVDASAQRGDLGAYEQNPVRS